MESPKISIVNENNTHNTQNLDVVREYVNEYNKLIDKLFELIEEMYSVDVITEDEYVSLLRAHGALEGVYFDRSSSSIEEVSN